MKRNVLIIGAGGVGHVVAHKCAQNNDRLGDIHLASRRVEKCDRIHASVRERRSLKAPGLFETHALDAMDVEATRRLIERTKAGIVINVGAPFINMPVLTACLQTGAAYIDTAVHEKPDDPFEGPPWYANHEWPRAAECAAAGVTAILGAGFDPGVVNAYAALARDAFFDAMDSIDIIDVNAGNHGRYFATNFDPETNLREFRGPVWYWEDGGWKSARMFETRQDWDLPVVGRQATYLTGHDEIHSLSRHMDVPHIRFWMGFSDHYVSVFRTLDNLGLLSEKPVRTAEGVEVEPIKVVKAVLPDPASLAAGYTGKTCIGTLVRGRKNGKEREVFIYNVCDHAECYAEVGSQAISYTAGVPPVAAALLVADGRWDAGRMVNVEELPPQPFLELLNRMGLPTRMREGDKDRALSFEPACEIMRGELADGRADARAERRQARR